MKTVDAGERASCWSCALDGSRSLLPKTSTLRCGRSDRDPRCTSADDEPAAEGVILAAKRLAAPA